ncbi:MAG: glycosyl hydrolase [Lactovum sp.]
MKKLIENLENKTGNYLYPFFWQHGESNEVLGECVDQIYKSGIRSFCIESRHFKDYLTEEWWRSLDYIIKKAKAYQMKVWILDDSHFPTGIANGQVPDYLKKRYLNMRRFDLEGPIRQAEVSLFTVADLRVLMQNPNVQDDKIIKIILAKNEHTDLDNFDEESLVDITSSYKEGVLRLDIPIGSYSIFVMYESFLGGEEMTKDYLDPTRKEATQILIDTVYESHYKRYKEEFGKTIVGFFSDEPRFGNIKGTDAVIGQKEMVLPWNEEIQIEFQKSENLIFLPFLFKGKSEKAKEVRFTYMNCISYLYSQNFTSVLGDWCKEKGIDYVGHIIEDNGAHARLGYGTGHYFRGIAGQTIAGIDIIGGQIVPGMDYKHSSSSKSGSNGEFYHYALCKMGASAAKLDPNKKGKLMCEAFGAYGWVEGLKMMKWISNHMLSHGVNLIVPHAFDPNIFPDWDCPPHFYARGNNPQFPYFSKWVDYNNRLCHLLNEGYQESKIGVLYHAFAEWQGKAMPIEKVLKELTYHQISADIISEDYLLNAEVETNTYVINQYKYEVLIIPESEKLPQYLLDKIKILSKSVKVIFINTCPKTFEARYCQQEDLYSLAEKLRQYKELILAVKEKALTFYHYVQEDGDVYLFNNESISKTIHEKVKLKTRRSLIKYNAFTNESYQLEFEEVEEGISFDLELAPYEMLVLVTGESMKRQYKMGEKKLSIRENFDISLKAYNEKDFQLIYKNSPLINLALEHIKFTGNIRYSCQFDTLDTKLILSIKDVGEIVEVFVNGINCGVQISPKYVFDISSACQKGKNRLEIIVTNNLARALRDGFSQYLPLEGLGILSEIELFKKI